MDIISQIIQPANAAPQQVYMTMNAPAEELTALRDTIERALAGSPAVVELRTGAGIPLRLIVDRLGPAVRTQ